MDILKLNLNVCYKTFPLLAGSVQIDLSDRARSLLWFSVSQYLIVLPYCGGTLVWVHPLGASSLLLLIKTARSVDQLINRTKDRILE